MQTGATAKAVRAESVTRDQFAALAECLARLRERFILSINDLPEIRETFEGFAFHKAKLTYSVGGGKDSARELIVTDRIGSASTSSSTRF